MSTPKPVLRALEQRDGHVSACSIADCTRPRRKREWCQTHYEYWRRNGKPTPPTPEQKFWGFVIPADTGCWEWTGYRDRDGYGICTWGGKHARAHRVAYEMLFGYLDADRALDHLCKNRSCVRPQHLEPVTWQQNNARSGSLSALNARKTHCSRGHEFTDENTRVSGGKRACRTCDAMRARRRRARLHQEANERAAQAG